MSFHGGLVVPTATDLAQMKTSLLILHGASDPTIQPGTIVALQKALTDAKADWEMVYYGGAVHAFSNPAAVAAPGSATGYQPAAARRSWEAMASFLREVLALR